MSTHLLSQGHMLSHHMCTHRNGPFTATDLAVQVDVEMAAAGHPPPLTSLFRGCRICVLPDTAGAPTDPGLQKLRLNYLQSLVRPLHSP